MKSIRTENFTRIIESTNFRFLEAMEDLVRIRDKFGEILFENKAMRKVIQTLILKDKHSADSETSFFKFYNEYKNLRKENQILETEVNLDNILYSVKISPIYDNKSEIMGYIEVYRDITLERNITKELYLTNEHIQEQIVLAKNIQKSILPKRNKIKNISFQYGYEPSEDLSGDLFDVIEITKNKIGVYIADVVGHGISASIMTMFIRQSIRSVLNENPYLGASDTIRMLKKMFRQLDLDVDQYFSIFYMVIDLDNKKICYVNAGHNCMPILFNDKYLAYLPNKGKFISNLFPDEAYIEKELDLYPDDRIFIYTDGLIETVNYKGELFGEERLVNWIKKNRQEEDLVEKLLKEINLFRWKEQTDDIAILYLKIGREENET